MTSENLLSDLRDLERSYRYMRVHNIGVIRDAISHIERLNNKVQDLELKLLDVRETET